MKFLGRARRFFQELASEPESKVQYFNVTCASGHRVRGERTEGYQALRCPACGEGVFVLPRSPLPEPAAPGRSPGRAKASHGRTWVEEGPVELTDPGRAALEYIAKSAGEDESGSADAEIIWEEPARDPVHRTGRSHAREHAADAGPAPTENDEPFWEQDLSRAAAPSSREASEGRRKKPVTDGSTPAGDTRPARPRPSAAAPSNPRGRRPKVPEPAVIEIETRRKKPRAITAIIIVVPLLVMTAVAWRYRRQVRAEYPLIAETGKTEGIPALEEGNFPKAYQLLSAAKAAVDALGGAVEGADLIRDAADEAAIFVDQSPRVLEEMLEEAGKTAPPLWASRFNDLYKGRAVLIDSTIIETLEDGPSARYRIDYVILPQGGANNFNDVRGMAPILFGLIDFTGFQLFELARPSKGNRVIFGAKLASFQLDKTGDFWWVGLEPKSGVFITHTKALEAMGWPRRAEDDLAPESQP